MIAELVKGWRARSLVNVSLYELLESVARDAGADGELTSSDIDQTRLALKSRGLCPIYSSTSERWTICAPQESNNAN